MDGINGTHDALSSREVGMDATRRGCLLAPLLAVLPAMLASTSAEASHIDPAQTAITLPHDRAWKPWTGIPPHIGEMAALYGSIDQPGPYLVLMKWYPGYFSAPHTYATDRLSLVISGTWWVNSGSDFDPNNTVPVPAGGFVRRVARTPHYDGVKPNQKEPAIIGLFGIGPVDMQLADPQQPRWRRI